MSILVQPPPVRLGVAAFYERYGQQRYELVYRPDARQQIFEREQTLVIEDLLPGFTLRVGELFV